MVHSSSYGSSSMHVVVATIYPQSWIFYRCLHSQIFDPKSVVLNNCSQIWASVAPTVLFADTLPVFIIPYLDIHIFILIQTQWDKIFLIYQSDTKWLLKGRDSFEPGVGMNELIFRLSHLIFFRGYQNWHWFPYKTGYGLWTRNLYRWKRPHQALFSYLKLRVALKEQYLIIYNNIHQFLTV